MKIGVQRRLTALVPPEEEDVEWVFSNQPGISTNTNRIKDMVLRIYRQGLLVVGVMKRVADSQRIGFVIMSPPQQDGFWEFSFAIPNPADRNAFAALNTCDAISHYMFDHRKIALAGWRIESENRRAEAIARRMGYEPSEIKEHNRREYRLYRLDRERWENRKRRIEAMEQRFPSGIGGALVLLRDPPFDPIVPQGSLQSQ